MPSWGVVWALAATLVVASSVACRTAANDERREALTFDRLPPVDLRLRIDPRSDARATLAARRALTRLGDWLGAPPFQQLTIVPADASASSRSVVAVNTPWLASARGGALESEIVIGIARQFWGVEPASAEPWLREGLALYVAAKVLDDQFAGEHAYERRWLGGLVPYALRSVPIEGPDAQLARLPATPEAVRTAAALFTLERYLGWAALQQALSAFAERAQTGPVTVANLFETLDAVSGRDLRWFQDEVFHSTRTFDYGVDRLSTTPASRAASFDTSVVVRRYGDAVFAGTSQAPTGPYQSTGPLEVLVRFADGSEIRERWDGRDGSVQYDYESRSPAVSAAIDPDRVLWLDRNPANNQRTLADASRGALAWAARWSVWMQDQLLDYAFFF